MGKRGPAPTPAHLRVLRGDPEHTINRDEPVPAEAVVRPVGLSAGALGVWDRLAPDLIDKGVLTAWDTDMFGVFCHAVWQYHEARRLVGDQYTASGAVAGCTRKSPYWLVMTDCVDTMSRLSSRFGMSPGDRANLRVSRADAPSSGAARLLG